VTSPLSLAFPAAGPATPVPIALSYTTYYSSPLVRYRFDSSSAWKIASDIYFNPLPSSVSIGVAEFANYLTWSQSHSIQFAYADGFEEDVATVTYTVTPPSNHFAPAISFVNPHRRVRATGPSTTDRNFSLTINDEDNGPLFVDYRFATGPWSATRRFPSPGTHSLLIPAALFNANPAPGVHTITFRVSDVFDHGADITANATYVVNTAPTLTITGQSTVVSIPETGSFEQPVAFTLGDQEGDAVSVLYAIDSTTEWHLYRSGVTGGAIDVVFTDAWPSPRLSGGTHTVAWQVSDGMDVGAIVQLSVTVAGEGKLDDGGLGPGAIAGIVIAVVVVLAAAGAAVYFLVIRKSSGSANDEKPGA
jgi:hypothetical protein